MVINRQEYARESERKLNTPLDFPQAIKNLRFDKIPNLNCTPNRILRYLSKSATILLAKLFDAVLRRRYFPTAWKHIRMVTILKPRKDPTLPSSCRHISLLDTAGKLFDKILLTRFPREENERCLSCDKQFAFPPRLITTLQLAHLIESVNIALKRRANDAASLDATFNIFRINVSFESLLSQTFRLI
jgi:hypothetical protein